MTSIRAMAIGLLAGGAGTLVLDPRGDGPGHVRLAMLTGLLAGQLLTVPASLIGGVVRARARKGGPLRLYDLSVGPLLVASGALVVTQAWAVVHWLGADPVPGGVGDPDGETSLGLIAGLSGSVMVLVGVVLLANGVRSSRRPAGG
ncbi:hypothetical protein AB0E77_23775 [Streptomyces sp. NPDC032940]|uniref:hypothetical protein n=1 Tax=Streptomyces sp. NPDC032940 TaxID=3155366 RepID=UPI0033C0DC78